MKLLANVAYYTVMTTLWLCLVCVTILLLDMIYYKVYTYLEKRKAKREAWKDIREFINKL